MELNIKSEIWIHSNISQESALSNGLTSPDSSEYRVPRIAGSSSPKNNLTMLIFI